MSLAFCALVLAAAAKVPAAAIAKLEVAVPDADHLQLTLRAAGPVGKLAPLASHHLAVGSLAVPLEGAPDITLVPSGFEARFRLSLARVPEAVLTLDPNALPLRFEARDERGQPVVVAEGTLDLGDADRVSVPLRRVYELYTRLDRLDWSPSLTTVGFRALLSFYNPFSFPITVQRIEAQLRAGETELFATTRPGFRLKPQQRGDVLVEEEVPLASLSAATQALFQQQPLRLLGQAVLQTPRGARSIPLFFGTP